MSPQEMIELYEYNAWADRRVLAAASNLSKDQFTQPICSSFPSVRDTLGHIFGVEQLWFERFQGRSPSAIPVAKEFEDVESLKTRWGGFAAVLLNFVYGLTQVDLDGILEYKTMKFGVYRNPRWQSMLHLVNHGTYHRGQVTTMLRQLGAEPILTDLMHFYRERAAAATA